jgi:hypothetical protein
MGRHAALLIPVLVALAAVAACGPEPTPPGPFELAEEAAWRQVNSSHEGADGIFVQGQLRTFAYEIASAYARAAKEDLSQEQLEYRLRQVIHSYIDGTYPLSDGTDINSLFYQYLVYVNPAYEAGNPLQKQVFGNWRSEFVRRLIDRIYDRMLPVLRNEYDDRWGVALYSRLVFIVYLKNEGDAPPPPIADIGSRTILVDEAGNRYAPSGTAGAYPYDSDRPATDMLSDEAVYRVFFPNRRADKRTPIVAAGTRSLALEIEGLGDVPVRRLEWQLPFTYPELLERRLRSESQGGTPGTGR